MGAPGRRTVVVLGALTAASSVVAACAGPEPTRAPSAGPASPSGRPLVVGSADFTESRILALVYVGALRGRGVAVASPKLGIGPREAYLKRLADGSVDVVPEYTGALTQHYDQAFTGTDPDQVHDRLTAVLPAGLTALTRSPAENKDALVVVRQTADRHGLTTLTDLAAIAPTLTLGAPVEFAARTQGTRGLRARYGITFKAFSALKGAALVAALRADEVQVADIFTTDPAIPAGGLVALGDPLGLFGAQNVVPLLTRKVAAPQVVEALDAVSAKLTTESLQMMLAQVDGQGHDPAVVAGEFLTAQGLD